MADSIPKEHILFMDQRLLPVISGFQLCWPHHLTFMVKEQRSPQRKKQRRALKLDEIFVLHLCSTMKTATVRDLRNHYSGLLKWIEAGEEVRSTRRGKAVARLVPEPLDSGKSVDWSQSPAVLRERRASERMSAATAQKLIGESAGKW